MTSYRGVEAIDWFGFSRLWSLTVCYAKTTSRIDSQNRRKTRAAERNRRSLPARRNPGSSGAPVQLPASIPSTSLYICQNKETKKL